MRWANVQMRACVTAALDLMDPLDREVLTLRHFEQLSSSEAALELNISVEAAKKRHVRALKRLKVILTSAGAGEGEP